MSNVKNYTEQGGEKTVIGGSLAIAEGGKLLFNDAEFQPAENQAASIATDVETLVTDFNDLLTKLKTAGLMKSE